MLGRLDPQREVVAVRRLAIALVAAHDEFSLTGVVAPVADPEGPVTELVARVAGFGPLQPLLEDPTVEEVWINSPDRRETHAARAAGAAPADVSEWGFPDI